ncbi:endonuclease/exonuclease/phosphatase family protein [Nocardiopsis gilva YIM 90087]|uniref:Endonuclease/exonuclease/phosphatase family protein n=1 Tax=Nocardiopsis gilva YIM 90087 TaxID=1235441 RepID=A0A223S5Q2_9ACTN|nr:endonuclease/exonuclease/phosphatase family protein [Nocardiopsis gilva]ASU83452.1 endonuclease/exonuclease/phosphatase family protein [Nocardiopsis gilva YIM 90087]
MIPRHRFPTALAATALLTLSTLSAIPATADTTKRAEGSGVRFATFNASLHRSAEGELIEDLSTGDDGQARAVAEIIQRNRPDVLLVNEFDHDADGRAAELFQDNYLAVGQNGAEPITYPYRYTAPSNTGVPSEFDLDNNGEAVTEPGAPGYGEDAFGFGQYPGQYGTVVYSAYPIDTGAARTFQEFRWADMPGAHLPTDPETGEGFYSEEELEVLRLSSKSHWDLPVRLGRGRTVHLLASHPTPPAFDGPERRNALRNSDETRFWADYVTPRRGGYIYDDKGARGGLKPGARFVVVGDLNADPNDSAGPEGGITDLLGAPLVNDRVAPASAGAVEAAELQGGANDDHTGDPALDTADFNDKAPGNLRVDYVLPSRGLPVRDTAVYWPTTDDPMSRVTGAASDHRLVWLDIR